MFGLQHFEAVNNYCISEGSVGGFPTGYINNEISSLYGKIGIIRMHNTINSSFEVKQIEQNEEYRFISVEELIKKVNQPQLLGEDFIGAFPTFKQEFRNNKTLISVILIPKQAGDLVTIPISHLQQYNIKIPIITLDLFCAVNKYLYDKGTFTGGFPINIEGSANHNNSIIHVIGIKPNYCIYEEITDLQFYIDTYIYDQSFTYDQKLYIRKSLNEIVRSFPNSPYLTEIEKRNLINNALKKQLSIYPLNESGSKANAEVNGSKIRVNLNLFPDRQKDFIDLCRTMIHELLHISGYEHPIYSHEFRQYAGCGCNGETTGVPDDAKKYWYSTPLRAECIFDYMTQNDIIY